MIMSSRMIDTRYARIAKRAKSARTEVAIRLPGSEWRRWTAKTPAGTARFIESLIDKGAEFFTREQGE